MALLSDKFKLKPQLSGADIKSLYEVEPNAFTDTDKTKLTSIESGAEVNVNADWNAVSGDAQILNKPTLDFEPADPTILKDADIGVSVQGYSANTVIDVDYSTVKATALSATQPGDLSTVATTGAYSDLSGLPTLGTAAATASTDYATVAQGTLADTALQPTETETVSGNYTFNGALYLPNNSRINNVEHFYQTTKPTTRGDSSALVAGDRWWKTDDGTEWFWNGTYWLSETILGYSLFSLSGIASNTTLGSNQNLYEAGKIFPAVLNKPFFFESYSYYASDGASVTMDESNYWELYPVIHRIDGIHQELFDALGPSTVSVTTPKITGETGGTLSVNSIFYPKRSNVLRYTHFGLRVIKVGSPANLYRPSASFNCRLIYE